MQLEQGKGHYTYTDYLSWDDGERWELIEGVPYRMDHSNSAVHQSILVGLMLPIYNFLRGKPCTLMMGPLDVRLNADGQDDTVVQPDLLAVCDKSKFDEKSCKGAPDFVVEIVSPTSAKMDRGMKFNQYKKAGVREYWIVDPDIKIVQVFILKDGLYFGSVHCETDTVEVGVLPGCMVDLKKVFEECEE